MRLFSVGGYAITLRNRSVPSEAANCALKQRSIWPKNVRFATKRLVVVHSVHRQSAHCVRKVLELFEFETMISLVQIGLGSFK